MFAVQSTAKLKDRRKVHSPFTGHVIPVLDEFVSQLRPLSTEIVLGASAFLCRLCVRNVEKLLKLRDDVMKEAELRQLVDRVGEAYGLQHVTPEERQAEEPPRHRTPEKCTAEEAGLETATSKSAMKRRRYDTPVRSTLQGTVPTGTSPAVAVSVIATCIYVCIDIDYKFVSGHTFIMYRFL